ncbi:MAG: hypothetical protein WBX15_12575 [Thermoanaerobaculia bacterium]
MASAEAEPYGADAPRVASRALFPEVNTIFDADPGERNPLPGVAAGLASFHILVNNPR